MTPELRAHILKIYLTRGFTAARPLVEFYGLSPKLMSKWARKAGHKGKRGREPGVWKTTPTRPPRRPRPHAKPKVKPSMEDRRWQWAIERGEIRI